MIRKRTIEEKVRSFALPEDEAIWKAIDCQHRLQNSPYFCVFKYARAVKQKVWNEALKGSRASRVRLLRHALPISLLILRKKKLTVLQSTD